MTNEFHLRENELKRWLQEGKNAKAYSSRNLLAEIVALCALPPSLLSAAPTLPFPSPVIAPTNVVPVSSPVPVTLDPGNLKQDPHVLMLSVGLEARIIAFSPDYKHMYVAFQVDEVLFDVIRKDGRPFTARSLNLRYHNSNLDIV